MTSSDRLRPANGRKRKLGVRLLANLETDIERSYPELNDALSPGVPGPLVPSGTDVMTPPAAGRAAANED